MPEEGHPYYTKAETDCKVAAATSRHLDITIAPADWQEVSDSFVGLAAQYKAEKPCEGMAAETDIVFLSGDGASAGTWSYLRPGAGNVTLFSATKPAGTFSLRLTEVK